MELLAPCGGPAHLEKAIRFGADACYFGAPSFSARAHAENFSLEEIKLALCEAHEHGVSMYAALNTLVYNDEIETLLSLVSQMGNHGVDAFIVQDLGLAKILRTALPEIPLHASTQMLSRHSESIQVLKELSFKRVVLARETPLEEMQFFKNQGLEVEIFVHGAQCISYSGACYFSAMQGGRSGNRGDCAQACRMPYLLYQNTDLCASGYLLSARDMDLLDHIPRLLDMGIDSLKIEGRMKNPAYLAATCRAYREAIDAAKSDRPLKKKERELLKKDMARVFNRGGSFSQGYALGNPGRENIFVESPKNLGLEIGKVIKTKEDSFLIELEEKLVRGDGYALYDENYNLISSGYVHNIKKESQMVQEAFPGDKVWIKSKLSTIGGKFFYRSFDKDFIKTLKKNVPETEKITLDIYFEARIGEHMSICLMDESYQSVQLTSDFVVEKAKTNVTPVNQIEAQLNRIGDTAFKMGRFYPTVDDQVFIPLSRLNELRRKAIQVFQEKYGPHQEQIKDKKFSASSTQEKIYKLLDRIPPPVYYPKETLISVEVSRMDQACVAIDVGCHQLMLNLTPYRRQKLISNKDLKELLSKSEEKNIELAVTWSPIREQKNDSAFRYHLKRSKAAGIDLLGVRNLSFIPEARNQGFRLQAEATMNITNDLAISSLVDLGFESVILSPEMSIADMTALSYVGNIQLGATIFGDLPLMYLGYCPSGAMSGGKRLDKKCSAPCLQGDFYLQDQKKQVYPILQDAFCRNEIYDGRLLDGVPYLSLLHEANLDQWRFSFVRQEPDVIGKGLDRLWTFLEEGQLRPLNLPRMDGFLIQGVKRTYV